MKKIMFGRGMIVTIVFFVVSALFSCKGQPDDIKLNDQFVAFAELSQTNDTLWGVKDSDGQVVKPGRYRDFALEGHVITCVGKDDSLKYAFTSKGAYIGKFELFNHWVESGEYYLGVNNKDHVFYFPKSGEIIKAHGVYFGSKEMFLEVNGKCEIRDYYGNRLWVVPIPDAIIVKEDAQDEYYIFAPEDWSKPPYDVYDINGKLLKKMPYPQYRHLIRRTTAIKAFERTAIISAENVMK